MKYANNFILLLLAAIIFFSCKNETETLISDNVTDYVPLQVGKYITYRLDSITFVKSGSMIETHKYQVKHIVQTETTDNQGRKTYVIQRLLNDSTASGAWMANGNYLITPTTDHIEVIDNNLRVVVLQMLMKLNFSWSGNQYLPHSPYSSLYDMNAGSDMNTWTFSYSNFGSEAYYGQSYSNVWTVVQNNNIQNIPPSSINTYGEKEVSIEKYSKNIGLVYKDYEIYEHQPPNADNPSGYYMGFGITMWMIDHN
jgi:hypothetical protein